MYPQLSTHLAKFYRPHSWIASRSRGIFSPPRRTSQGNVKAEQVIEVVTTTVAEELEVETN